MVAGDAEEEAVEQLAALGVQRGEEVVLDPLHELAQLGELLLPFRGERDRVPAAVVRVAAALEQASLLEAVEQADELAAVELERVGDRRLGLGGSLGQQGEDAVVVEARALRPRAPRSPAA